MSKLLSVIIPTRNEFPNVVSTCYSIWHAWQADGYDEKDIEIIIVDNCSTDWTDPKYDHTKPGTRGNISYLMPRGCYYSGAVRVLYFPIAGNHTARNKGAEIAKGKYLFFSDGHMQYAPGFFKHAIKACDESGGMVHGVIGWQGAYPPHTGGLGYQYTLKLGEEWKGTWANYKLSDDWFYIQAQGHCSVLVKRDQFLKFGGYNKVHRSYGGGELYTNLKWWMLGSCVVVEPKAIGYHLASGRGYTYNHNDYIENVLGVSYAMGADDWRERAYLNWLRHSRPEVMNPILARNEVEYKEEREWLEKNRKKTFNELIIERPWNKLNDARHGKHNAGILVFHPTWLELMQKGPEHAKEAYRNSKYQEQLSKFIVENLWDVVYHNDRYDKNNLPKI